MSHSSIGNKIFRGTIVIVFVGILAKVASFATEAILAAYLGTTYQSDAYYMVSSVQLVIYPMLSTGIWKVFLPLYKSHMAQEEKEIAESLANKTISFFTIVSFIVAVLLIFFAPAAVSVIAPGFEGETRTLCIRLVRISAPMYIFIIASAVYASILQCHEKFLGSQIREVASHVPTIIAAVFFYRKMGIEVMAVALVIAGVLRLIIELPFVNWGYRFRPDYKFRGQEFSLMLKRLPSALISASIAQLNTLVDKSMASMLPTGTISGLNYGHKLMNVFSGLLSSAIATAMYPQMIELITLKKRDMLSGLIVKIINIFCVLMVPITLACILFKTELVSAVFQRGAFNAESTRLTSNVFAIYCIGLFFIACSTVVGNIFYGNGDTKTPMYINLSALIMNIVFNLVLIRFWGVNGLAAATSLVAVITFFIRLILARKYVRLSGKRLLKTGIKVLVASVVACMIPRVFFWMYSFNKYLVLLISACVGIAIYLLMVMLLKVDELQDLIGLMKKRINKNSG